VGGVRAGVCVSVWDLVRGGVGGRCYLIDYLLKQKWVKKQAKTKSRRERETTPHTATLTYRLHLKEHIDDMPSLDFMSSTTMERP
jgi:hypothetical protein